MRLVTEIPEDRKELLSVLAGLLHRQARERNFRKKVEQHEGLDSVQADYFLGLVDDLRFVLEHLARQQGLLEPPEGERGTTDSVT